MEKISCQLTYVVAMLLVAALVPSSRAKCRSTEDCIFLFPIEKVYCLRQICFCFASGEPAAVDDVIGHPCAGNQDCEKFCDYFKCQVKNCVNGLCRCTSCPNRMLSSPPVVDETTSV